VGYDGVYITGYRLEDNIGFGVTDSKFDFGMSDSSSEGVNE
jgi:hypothetical protein